MFILDMWLDIAPLLLLGCGLIRSTPAPSEAPVMLQMCSLECSCSELSRGGGGESPSTYCLHCWSVFYSFYSLKCWLGTTCFSPSFCWFLMLFCHPNLACACPWRHHKRSLFTILIYLLWIVAWFMDSNTETTGVVAPAEDWFKPFHLISFPPPLLPPFLISFIRLHPLLVERAEKKAGYSNLNQHWQRSRCKKGRWRG